MTTVKEARWLRKARALAGDTHDCINQASADLQSPAWRAANGELVPQVARAIGRARSSLGRLLAEIRAYDGPPMGGRQPVGDDFDEPQGTREAVRWEARVVRDRLADLLGILGATRLTEPEEDDNPGDVDGD